MTDLGDVCRGVTITSQGTGDLFNVNCPTVADTDWSQAPTIHHGSCDRST